MTADNTTAVREFPTLDVLSTATGRLMADIGGVYEVVNWMTGESVYTHQLPRISREAAPVLLAAYPTLAAAYIEAESITSANYKVFAALWLDRYGPTLAVPKFNHDNHDAIDPLSELAEKIHPDRIVVATLKDTSNGADPFPRGSPEVTDEVLRETKRWEETRDRLIELERQIGRSPTRVTPDGAAYKVLVQSNVRAMLDRAADMVEQIPAFVGRIAALEIALEHAINIAGEAQREWDAAPGGMKAGKILIALSGGLPNYRADIDAIHSILERAGDAHGRL